MAVPLVFSVILLLLRVGHPKLLGWVAVAAVSASAALCVSMIPFILGGGVFHVSSWPIVAGLRLTLHVDALSVFMASLSSCFGIAAVLYSVADMSRHEEVEEGINRYYFGMALFEASMVGLALAGDLLTAYLFWEVVGICSYVLIGFYTEREGNVKASIKALAMTHIPGLVMLIGILAVWTSYGTLDYTALPSLIAAYPRLISTPLAFMVVGIIAKSVQTPVHTWLPDAGVAPSPVTAYLHAAAMVKAGVYLTARLLQLVSPLLMPVGIGFTLSTLGVVTMLVGAFMALRQVDVKRLLAYSTVSQIGYMFLGLGLGTALGVSGAVFHCLNHALFKGLLFLCAGALIYATGTRSLDEMGGLGLRMPFTAACTLIGALSLIGVPPFNGFVSKFILYEACLQAGGPVYTAYCLIALFTSTVTFVYIMKLFHGAFLGPLPERLKEVRDVPAEMRVPLGALAILCVLFGVYPQLPMKLLVVPASAEIVGVLEPYLKLTFLGIDTSLGLYNTVLVASLIAVFTLVGFVAYTLSMRPPAEVYDEAVEPFVGGEAPSELLKVEETRISPYEFAFPADKVFRSMYALAGKGGFDAAWRALARSASWLARGLARASPRSVNAYVACGVVLLLLLLIISCV